MSAAGSDELKQRMADLLTPLKEAADKAIDDRTTEIALAREVVELADQVNDVVNSWAANEAPAEPGAADESGGDVAAGQ